MDTPTHSPSAWGILPSQRWIQIIDLGLQETPLKEVESQQQETMQTSVPGQKTEGCSALLGCLALAVSIPAGRVSQLYKCAWEWNMFSETSESSLGTSWTGKEHHQHPKEGNLWTHLVKDGTHPQCTVLFQLCRIGWGHGLPRESVPQGVGLSCSVHILLTGHRVVWVRTLLAEQQQIH